MVFKLVQAVSYTASTGRTFVLQQLEDENARDGWPRFFWTYTYESDGITYGPGLGSLTDRHLTREAVVERLEAQERIRLAEESVPQGGLIEPHTRPSAPSTAQRCTVMTGYAKARMRCATVSLRSRSTAQTPSCRRCSPRDVWSLWKRSVNRLPPQLHP